MYKTNRKLQGIVISLLAIIILLSSLNIIQVNVIKTIFSLTLIISGVFSLLYSDRFLGLLGISFGLKYNPDLINNVIDFSEISYFKLGLIMLLLSIGLNLLVDKNRKRNIFFYQKIKKDKDILSGNFVSSSTSFSESTRYIYSNKIKQALHTVNLGSATIFYEDVILENDLEIEVYVTLGSLELYFPRDWHVIDNTNKQLAEASFDYNQPNSKYTVTLVGSVTLGNIDIKFI